MFYQKLTQNHHARQNPHDSVALEQMLAAKPRVVLDAMRKTGLTSLQELPQARRIATQRPEVWKIIVQEAMTMGIEE